MKLSERMFARAERMRKRGRRAYAMFLRRDAKKVAQLEAENEVLHNTVSLLKNENDRLTDWVEGLEGDDR